MPARSASSSSSKAAANNEKKKKSKKAADVVVAAEEDDAEAAEMEDVDEPKRATTTASPADTTSAMIADVVRAHFDARQRDPSSSSVLAAASALRRDLLSSSSAGGGGGDHPDGGDDDDDDVVAAAVVSCLDSAMSAILRSSSSSSSSSSSMRTKGQQQQQQPRGCCLESATSAWELAVAFSLLRPGGGGEVPTTIADRASGYASSCEIDAGRIEACRLLGTLVERIMLSSSSSSSSSGGSADGRANVAAASILKRGGNKRRKEGGGTTATSSAVAAAAASAAAAAAPWEVECLLLACRALSARVTDKIAKVRSAAIVACKPLLSLLPVPSSSSSSSDAGVCDDASAIARRRFLIVGDAASSGEELAGAVGSLVATLLWLVGNDPSAPNRSAVLGVLPPLASASAAEGEEEEEDSDAIVRAVIGRIKDVDVRVREAALDSLRTKVGDFNAELSEDARAEILRTGFSKRCPATYAKTVELLITNWLKTAKFDPILLLDRLDPVLNESACEEVARVLLRVASAIDREGAVVGGVELVREHFGGPEIRSLIQNVLKRRTIVDSNAASAGGIDGEDRDGCDDDDAPRRRVVIGMSPGTALFLRVRCEMSSSSEAVAEIIADVPTLCNLLNSHIDELIEFHNEDDEDMDEDEAAAYEDGKNFVCLQLMHMARSSELHREEGSRRHFVSIMRRILARLATPDDLVEACVKAMASAHDKESQFLQTISEILVDVEDDDTYQSKDLDPRAIVIVRQMRIIAILSIVLESVSGNVTSHPILDTFFEHLSPAITSKNAVVREHGVVCLSKFCLLSGEDKVMGEFRPLLTTIAGSVDERVEVRAQAALALCDLALIHERMLLVPTTGGGDLAEGPASPTARVPSFKDMLLEMLGHAKPGIVIIAAEIAAKLLLAGRLNDPTLIAWLVLLYFDSSLVSTAEGEDVDDGGAEEAAKKVGSPVRLQQLLSVFFPTYSMSSLDANDDMMASVGPLLSIVNQKFSVSKQADAKATAFPIAKMVEYICYNVDLADKKKSEEAKNDSFGTKVSCEEATATNDCEQTTENSQGCDDVGKSVTNSATEEKVIVIEASSILLASIDVAEFLSSEESDSAPTSYVRSLAKILASARIDVDAEDRELLRRLKSCVAEAEYTNDDGPTVKSIKKLANLLADVNDDEASSDDETAPFQEEEEIGTSTTDLDVEEGVAGEEGSSSIEKENSRLSVGTTKSTKALDGERRTSSSPQRVRLGDVNI